MNRIRYLFTTSLLSLAAGAALAAGSPGVEHNTQGFLEALAKGGGQPLETLSPADARAVLVGVQAGAKLQQADISERTITVDGQSIKLTLVRPAGAKGVLPAFMSCRSPVDGEYRLLARSGCTQPAASRRPGRDAHTFSVCA